MDIFAGALYEAAGRVVTEIELRGLARIAQALEMCNAKLRFGFCSPGILAGEADGEVVIAGHSLAIGIEHREHPRTCERIAD